MVEDDEAKIALAFLQDQHVVSLALADEGGLPHACSLMYALDGFTLYWLSDPAARHSRIIDSVGEVAAVATIAPDYTDFRQIRGLQVFGTVSRADGVIEAGLAMARMAARYGFLSAAGGSGGALARAMAKAAAYRLVPDHMVLIDNLRAFGAKTLLSRADLDSALLS